MPVAPSRSWLPAYFAVGIIWGYSFLFIKLSLGFLTPFGVAFIRCALGAATLLIIAALRHVSLPKELIVWCHLWVVAMCLNVVPGVLFALAETRTTSIVAGIINALTPLTSLFFILVVFREDPVQAHQRLGLFVGLLGVLVVLASIHRAGEVVGEFEAKTSGSVVVFRGPGVCSSSGRVGSPA